MIFQDCTSILLNPVNPVKNTFKEKTHLLLCAFAGTVLLYSRRVVRLRVAATSTSCAASSILSILTASSTAR